MLSPLRILTDRIVTEARVVHDYCQLAFGAELGLTIYNPVKIIPDVDIEELIGKPVKSALETEDNIELCFDDSAAILIDMRPGSYRGPEALELYHVGHPPIIWS